MRILGIGRCSLLGELVDETETRYFYRLRSALHRPSSKNNRP
jgi:hypothetical protein